LEGEAPLASWCEEWFEKLSQEMQLRYATSNPKRQDISSLTIETVQNIPFSSSSINE
jgi:hypothetical protein